MNTHELSTASAGEAKSNRAAAEYEVREWMGENDVVLKTPAFRALIDLVLAVQFAATNAAPGRAPLTDEQIESATGAKRGTPIWLVAVAFTRAIESAHGIAPAGGIGGE